MIGRTTTNLTSQELRRSVQRTYSRLFESQLQISSGKRITRPSDDPAGISRLLFFKTRAAELEQFSRNVAEAQGVAGGAASFLEDASSRIIDARETVVQALNGTLSADDRKTLADTIDGVLSDVLSLANSRLGNRFLFGGTVTDRPPFEVTTDASGQPRVTYQGNDDSIVTEIGPGSTSPLNLPGSRIFLADDRGATVFDGSTGAAPGSGTSNGRGVDRLIVAHTGTAYGGGGLAPSASSPGNDTIIGTHNVTLNVDPTGTSGTVSLNGGPPVSFTNPNTDLAVTGPAGEVIHVDVTGVTPGFSSTVAATAQGTLSVDGGLTTAPITFAPNEAVQDSLDGSVLYVDTTAIRGTGVERVRHEGTIDLFTNLAAIRDTLRTAGSTGDIKGDLSFVSELLDELDGGHDRLLDAVGVLGNIGARLESSEFRLEDLELRLRELVSEAEDVDISEAVIELQQNEAAYQSALLVTSRANDLSLLDFI